MRIPLLLLLGVALVLPAQDRHYFPAAESDGGWRKNTDPGFISSLGIDPDTLERFGRYNLSVPNTNWQPYASYKGILVIKNGWVIGEWYNTPEAAGFRTYLSSNGKAFAMVLMGMVIEDGKLTPDSKVYNEAWLPQGFPLSDPRKRDITFEQIFQHTSGLCPERTRDGEAVEQGRNEWTGYDYWVVGHDERWPQTARLYFDPGRPQGYPGHQTSGSHLHSYSSIAMNHLGLVMRNLYNKPAHQLLWERLLAPIGFSDIDFDRPPSGEVKWVTAGGLRITPRDYARFAYLLLRAGRWEDKQLVPTSWIQRFKTSHRYPNIRSNSDGFFGDEYPKDMFRIAGSGLNWAYIIPSLDLIAIRTGRANNAIWDQVRNTFLEKLFAAIR